MNAVTIINNEFIVANGLQNSLETGSPPQKILVVDDSPYIALVVTTLLGDAYEIDVAKNVAQMHAKLASHHFDLTLLDLDLQDGVRVVRILPDIKQKCRKIIVFSGSLTQKDFDACVAASVDGYLVKSGEPAELKRAVADVMAGHQAYPPERLASYCKQETSPMPLLHENQQLILKHLFARPMPGNAAIAAATGLSPGHVANILTTLFRLFGVRSRFALVEEARRRGFEVH